MSGSSEQKLLDVLRSMPRMEMDADEQASALENLKRVEIDGARDGFHLKKHRSRNIQRMVRTGAAVGAAVIVVAGAAYQVNQHRTSNQAQGPTKLAKSNTKSTLADSNTLKSMLGFQPMKPTYVPKGLVEQSTGVGIGNTYDSNHMDHSYLIDYGQHQSSYYPSPSDVSHDLIVTEEPISDSPLKDIQWHDITVNGVSFMEKNTRHPKAPVSKLPIWITLYRSDNGILYSVMGHQSVSELAKVLMSISVPATGTPDEMDRGMWRTKADTVVAFHVVLPTFLPQGFHQDITNTDGGTYTWQNRIESSSYNTSFKGPGGEIGISEYFTKNTKNPQVIDKNAVPVQIHGHHIYLVQMRTSVSETTMAPYYKFEWIDPKTNVSFLVTGGSNTTQERMTKSLMEKIVGTMLDQSTSQ